MSGTCAQLDRRHHRRDLHQPPEDVRERQEEQHGALAGTEQRAQPLHDVAALGEEAAVGEHAALGAAGGARRCRRWSPGRRPWRGELRSSTVRVGDVPAGSGSAPRPPPASICQTCLRAGSRSRTDSTAAGVRRRSPRRRRVAPESPRIHCDLLGRAGLVHRHGDRARAPDREVQQRPLVARAGHQRRPGRPAGPRRRSAPSRRPAPRRGTRSALTSCQAPPTLRAMTATSGCCAAFRRTMSVRLPSAGTSYKAGRLNSRKTAAPHRAPAPRRLCDATARSKTRAGAQDSWVKS